MTVRTVPAWTLWNRTHRRGVVRRPACTPLAEVKLVLGYEPDSGQEIRFPDGTRRVLTIRDIASSVPAWEARERIKAETFASAWLGRQGRGSGSSPSSSPGSGGAACSSGASGGSGAPRWSRPGSFEKRLRPAHLRARDRMPGWKALRPYSIAGIPYPERTETQHTIVSGTTGSGKTVLISDLVAPGSARRAASAA